ncbi:hypothetical protein AQUSIP_25950 [Aquicella siphonis]|uniref:ATPase domain-containing protein n=1 Tax=Aquicella siphonis TaxID=254247 RepID=A0A5E4PL39_9COXI|nr:hypothetical protein [Aquicella siphonis]VVC77268.1 hypothetical protein AQUSIP_25950 [Aquicella siphonis]
MNKEYFPLGIAKGNAFCNRVAERQRLVKNIKAHQHTLITSPRRYGKTSLVLFVLEKLGIPHAKVDLFVALNAKACEEQLIQGVQRLLGKISTKPERMLTQIRDYFSQAKKRWTIGFKGLHLELTPEKDSDAAINIMDALLALESILAKKRQRAVLFIDEFQEIGALPSAKALEGAIRHVAQETRYLLLVFSGSNRHLLTYMFDDKSRPLYMLCERIILDRIDEAHYADFINKIALKTWKRHFPDETLSQIFTLTERHPYYMNVLCNALWKTHEDKAHPPDAQSVKKIWQEYIYTERTRISRELSYLSFGQRKILTAIAFGNATELTGKHFLQLVGLTGPSVINALEVLENRDLVGRKEAGNYFIIDPLMKAALLFFYQDSFKSSEEN